MIYERLCYMCPECSHMQFFNSEDEFSTICSRCKVEMLLVEKKIVSSESEERKQNKINRTAIVQCPYCNSINTKKISGMSKAGSIALFGVFAAGKVTKEWHCNSCNSNF